MMRTKRTWTARKARGARPGSGWKRGAGALAAALGFMAVAAAAPWAAGAAYRHTARMPMFTVGEVQVSGLRHVGRDDLLRYAGDPTGMSVFDVDKDAMAARLKAHPWVRQAWVRRELTGSVIVVVDERVPAALVVKGGREYLADTEGVVLTELNDRKWGYLPAVGYLRSEGPAGPGGGPNGDLVMALELLDAVRSEPSETLAGALVFVGEDGLPRLELDGVKVSVGAGGYAEKARRLAEIFPDVKRRGVAARAIDLRFPGKVVVDGGGPVPGAPEAL